jgi:hypothetical protein
MSAKDMLFPIAVKKCLLAKAVGNAKTNGISPERKTSVLAELNKILLELQIDASFNSWAPKEDTVTALQRWIATIKNAKVSVKKSVAQKR